MVSRRSSDGMVSFSSHKSFKVGTGALNDTLSTGPDDSDHVVEPGSIITY